MPDEDRPVAAIAAGFRRYLDWCPKHQLTPFSVITRACATCTPDRALPYNANPLRAEARRNGQKTFMGACDAHGAGPCWVLSAKPICCFLEMGKPRVKLPGHFNPRATARKEGQRRYPWMCETHGATEFWVHCGRCAECYHENGKPRSWPKTDRNDNRWG